MPHQQRVTNYSPLPSEAPKKLTWSELDRLIPSDGGVLQELIQDSLRGPSVRELVLPPLHPALMYEMAPAAKHLSKSNRLGALEVAYGVPTQFPTAHPPLARVSEAQKLDLPFKSEFWPAVIRKECQLTQRHSRVFVFLILDLASKFGHFSLENILSKARDLTFLRHSVSKAEFRRVVGGDFRRSQWGQVLIGLMNMEWILPIQLRHLNPLTGVATSTPYLLGVPGLLTPEALAKRMNMENFDDAPHLHTFYEGSIQLFWDPWILILAWQYANHPVVKQRVTHDAGLSMENQDLLQVTSRIEYRLRLLAMHSSHNLESLLCMARHDYWGLTFDHLVSDVLGISEGANAPKLAMRAQIRRRSIKNAP